MAPSRQTNFFRRLAFYSAFYASLQDEKASPMKQSRFRRSSRLVRFSHFWQLKIAYFEGVF
jgi:hypothetical protein